ncbi:MAG TPA: hypothetical protein PK198_16185, partial [Saprospiraceae bacterium]|nr:hypothetical protein [Saprospiraceae bacterium]
FLNHDSGVFFIDVLSFLESFKPQAVSFKLRTAGCPSALPTPRRGHRDCASLVCSMLFALCQKPAESIVEQQ